MKISYDWLKQYLNTSLNPEEMAEILTNTGLEVGGAEKVEKVNGGLEGLVVGEVLEVSQHQNADRLKTTVVDVGTEKLNIVCGAPNVAEGQKVIVATAGTTLYPVTGDPFKIKKGKIRGEVSNGMICALDEIGLGADHDGIVVLDSSAKVGSAVADYYNLAADTVLEIDLTPNRSDAISHIGVARDVFAYQKTIDKKDVSLNWPDVSQFKVDSTDRPVEVEISKAESCPRYSGITLSQIKVTDSPEWLQARLKSIGLKPINNVVDVTNFVQHELGQPLHAFDADKILGNKIIVKCLEEGSPFITLDGEKRKMSAEDLMICNEEEGMAIAGVFGGADSGVSKATTSIFIESAYFNPVGIRKTARRHGLNTDASFRYERGTDPDITIYALKRAALLVQEIAGGQISSDIVDVYPEKIKNVVISLLYSRVNRLIGDSIDQSVIVDILTALDFKILEKTAEGLLISAPLYRADVKREVDVIEEILRIYGYNNIQLPEQLRSSLPGQLSNSLNHEKEIKRYLSNAGFWEIMSNSITRSSYYQDKLESAVNILNPLSSELDVMRQSLLFGSLESLRYNSNRKTGVMHSFEFGKIYSKHSGGKYQEERRMIMLMTSPLKPENWNRKSGPGDFFHLKEQVEAVFERSGLKLDSFDFEELSNQSHFDYGIAYKKGEKVLVSIGAVNQKTLKQFEINSAVFYADFNWDQFTKLATKKEIYYQAVPKYPVVRRDLALLVDTAIPFAQIRELAFQTERKLLKSVGLFDVYSGKGMEEGKKSYALSFHFGSSERTLKDEEVDKAIKSIYSRFQSELGLTLRMGEI